MSELEQYSQTIKKNIEKLINNNDLEEAKKIIKEYGEIVPNDIDIYSFKGVIALIEENLELALVVLKDGIDKSNGNFDLYYNLAYLYESQKRFIDAYENYKKALEFACIEIKEQLETKIDELLEIESVKEYNKKEKHSSKSPKISIVTMVYNVKQYIEQCIHSVLNQSFKDFEWVVLDNGCTDGTSEILKKYAKKDNRIKLYRNEKNSFIHKEPHDFDYIYHINNFKSEYVCYLDSDDYLHIDFLKELYTVAQKNNSDIAVGGCEMFREENPEIKDTRCPPNFCTNDISDLGDIFPEIYGCFRPMWGKLIRSSIVMKSRKELVIDRINMTNGGDTMFSLSYLEFSNSVVAIKKVLYNYRVRETSTYNSDININRYLDYIKIYDKSKKMLKDWNKLNDTNLYFISTVLYLSMKDCIDVVVNSTQSPIEDRIKVITTIISDNDIRKTLNHNGILLRLIDDAINGLNIMAENHKALNFTKI